MVFDKLPDAANVWIYTASRPLQDSEKREIMDSLAGFFSEWQSHGRRVAGQAEFVGDRFLLIGAHIPDGDISGCGIDASSRAANIALDLDDVQWVDNLHVAFRRGAGDIQVVSRPMFREYVQNGQVEEDTSVFDLSVTTVSDVRSGRFEKPFRDSWHASYFQVAEPK